MTATATLPRRRRSYSERPSPLPEGMRGYRVRRSGPQGTRPGDDGGVTVTASDSISGVMNETNRLVSVAVTVSRTDCPGDEGARLRGLNSRSKSRLRPRSTRSS